jgi:hypothetical protein
LIAAPDGRHRVPPTVLTRALLGCGVVAGPAFVVVFLVEGAARIDYHPLRHPVSSLALGRRGWIQSANFVMAGTLFLAGAAGLSRTRDRTLAGRVEPALVGAAGIGLLAAAVFPTDPVSGYPPETSAITAPTTTGKAHNLAAVPVFVGLPAAAAFGSISAIRRRHFAWGAYSAATALAMLATGAVAGAGFGQVPRFVRLAGTFQRASIVLGFTWAAALCASALQRFSQSRRAAARFPGSLRSRARFRPE